MYQNAFAKHISMLCKLAVGPTGTPKPKPCVVVAVSSPFDFSSDTSIGTYVCTYDFTETALLALVKVLYGELNSAGTLPGSFIQKPQTSHSRQHWLVESFNEERDRTALELLLEQCRGEPSVHARLLQNTTTNTFLLRDPEVEEAHFVVRNSSTKELFGFCTTYFNKSSGVGHLGAIIVDPTRRRLSIGHSLHDRAVRALLQRKGITKFQLGVRYPHVYLGIPRIDAGETKNLRQWFAKLGWNVSLANPVSSMTLRNLATWTPPEGLAKSLNHSDVKYDLVHGPDYTDAMMDHLTRSARLDVQGLYKAALSSKDHAGIIRAKTAGDQKQSVILASVLVLKPDFKGAEHVASWNRQAGVGCISSPVISTRYSDRMSLFQGLLLLALRYFKKQAAPAVMLDYVSGEYCFSRMKKYRKGGHRMGRGFVLPFSLAFLFSVSFQYIWGNSG